MDIKKHGDAFVFRRASRGKFALNTTTPVKGDELEGSIKSTQNVVDRTQVYSFTIKTRKTMRID
jgi:hypothetical protein